MEEVQMHATENTDAKSRMINRKNYLLELNKVNEVVKFIEIVKPHVNQIDFMKYKIDLEIRLEFELLELKNSHPDKLVQNLL